MLDTTLGTYLKKQRIESGFTQKGIADRLHLDRSLISKYENDELIPTESIFEQYCVLIRADYKYAQKLIDPRLSSLKKKKTAIVVSLITVSILIIVLLTIPILKYPGYISPYSAQRGIIWSSFLAITLQRHNPMAMINIVLLSMYIFFLFILLFIRAVATKKQKIIFWIITLAIQVYSIATVVVSIETYLFFYY